jgi:hypothetical protein
MAYMANNLPRFHEKFADFQYRAKIYISPPSPLNGVYLRDMDGANISNTYPQVA